MGLDTLYANKDGKAKQCLGIASSQLGLVTQDGLYPKAPGLRTSVFFWRKDTNARWSLGEAWGLSYLLVSLGSQRTPPFLYGATPKPKPWNHEPLSVPKGDLPLPRSSHCLWPGLFVLRLHNGEERTCFLGTES